MGEADINFWRGLEVTRAGMIQSHTHWRLEHGHYLWDVHWLILFMLEIPTKRELIHNILYLYIHCIIIYFLDTIEAASRYTVTCRLCAQKVV